MTSLKRRPFSRYIIWSGTAAVLLLTAQISLAGSATWLLSPQDSAWENANNWTPGGPPNGPSDIATFAQSSQSRREHLDVGGGEQHRVHLRLRLFRIVSHLGHGGELIISGTGVINNNSVLQTFLATGRRPDNLQQRIDCGQRSHVHC